MVTNELLDYERLFPPYADEDLRPFSSLPAPCQTIEINSLLTQLHKQYIFGEFGFDFAPVIPLRTVDAVSLSLFFEIRKTQLF